jgi:putative membrane-bound dehydrogenase-like protein
MEARRSPQNATGSFLTAEGLQVSLFAAEPLVVNPTNMDIDHQGRVWVLESPNYGLPNQEKNPQGGRITILEDTDGDGVADISTLFYQGPDVDTALGIAVLGNKVYVTRSPHLLVFTDNNGDDIPDSKEIVLTGMGKPGDHSSHALVFGPDGKFYWNMGNYAGPVQDSTGNTIIDKMGNPVIQYGDHYLGGMVFRCNTDFSEFEVLGHNFRNNYEVAVDSYGNLWQSDNDDDGNKSVRINFVMEYGNFGYLDEMTHENWGAYRTNMSEVVSEKHWHQNDPGVVPNLLITGAGSPAGIAVYEGSLLPEPFRNQLVHTDAGPNVVRAYPTEKDGAGFRASSLNIVHTELDQWFRPIDIASAPDGSLLVADWYDPLVGGGAAGEFTRGRIFRIAPENHRYQAPGHDFATLSGMIEALKSPNMATRYLAWTALYDQGEAAEQVLVELYQDDNPVYRARALWLLGKLPGSQKHLEAAFKDPNPDLRITALRSARQQQDNYLDLAAGIAQDPAIEVRREIAVSLHPYQSNQAAQIWANLALNYEGGDRWYLEALGIGAANNWTACLEAVEKESPKFWSTSAGKEIIWRSRAPRSLYLLADVIREPTTDRSLRLKLFRSFDFLEFESKNQVLTSLLEGDHPEQDHIRLLALQHIDANTIPRSRLLVNALETVLELSKNTREFINLVDRFDLTNYSEDLLQMTIGFAGDPLGIDASKLLLAKPFNGYPLIRTALKGGEKDAISIVECLGSHGGTKTSLDLLSEVVLGADYSLDTKTAAVNALGKSWSGETELMECVKHQSFEEQLKPVAASVLFNVYRAEIHDEAEKYLERPGSIEGKPLPSIRTLVASNGNISQGTQVFDSYCQTCHVVRGRGTAFGPELTEIGNKLSKEGLYRAIMFPDEGINHGYDGYTITLKDGTTTVGILESQTSDFIEVKLVGGIKNKVVREDIERMQENAASLMPNLSTVMTEEQLVDLVEYLSQLKPDNNTNS